MRSFTGGVTATNVLIDTFKYCVIVIVFCHAYLENLLSSYLKMNDLYIHNHKHV